MNEPGRRGGLLRDTPMTGDETRRRLGVAQVEALFGSIPLATSPAYFACVILAAGFGSLGFVKFWTGFA